MDIQELKESLSYFYEHQDQIGVTVYAISRLPNQQEPKKLDIEADAQSGLKQLFLKSIKDTIIDVEELAVMNLSTSDERVNVIYAYDIEIPQELSAIDTVIANDNLPTYNLDAEKIGNIKALLIEIGNNEKQVILYKTIAPIHIFSQSSFCLVQHETRLEKIDKDFLRISPGFQMLKIDGELLVNDLAALERSFGFHEIIKKEATLGITAIEDKLVIENVEALRELLEDIKYARRFVKVAKGSPVLIKNIPNTSIISFCKTFPALAGRIRFNQAEDKIVLDSKVSKDLFIKLLMDNFLTSDLTKFHYESVAKDSLDKDVAA
ncbi:anti-phage protein KwaB [Methylotenera mobilis]|uniref:DUF4868 domain-containing protein n=1 Tax=Methylotenera mobilis (strain JLW8 / ATCC BAA-1282 / DSM 17540) TaxID=583345 RepID=C6WSP3_METML|nr:anti-phage protein KwaB [Methylotenera mobilis]ACT47135.1 hypothetical protein Mmol_0225 [Methylotenera mobilis JLW8]